jgi:hypothetical protein
MCGFWHQPFSILRGGNEAVVLNENKSKCWIYGYAKQRTKGRATGTSEKNVIRNNRKDARKEFNLRAFCVQKQKKNC